MPLPTNHADGETIEPEHINDVAAEVNSLRADVDAIGGPGVSTIRWSSAADGWDAFGDVLVNGDPLDTIYTTSEVTETVNSVPVRLGKVLNANVTGGTNTRRWYPFNGLECADQEAEVTFFGAKDTAYSLGQRTGSGYGQQGIILRYNSSGGIADPDRPWAVVIWHDIAFGAPYVINSAIWEPDGVGFNNHGTSLDFTLKGGFDLNPLVQIQAQGGSLTSNVATLLAPHHNVRVKDRIGVTVPTATGLNVSTAEVASIVDAARFTYPKTNANIANAWAPGWGVNYSRVFPLTLKARMIGTRLYVKQWPAGQGEPDWSDPNYGFWRDMPLAPASGQPGLMANHLDPNVSRWLGFGPATFKNLDGQGIR
jgi:hypothetical protein